MSTKTFRALKKRRAHIKPDSIASGELIVLALRGVVSCYLIAKKEMKLKAEGILNVNVNLCSSFHFDFKVKVGNQTDVNETCSFQCFFTYFERYTVSRTLSRSFSLISSWNKHSHVVSSQPGQNSAP